MPTPVKNILVFTSILLVFIVGLMIFIQTQVTPEKIRDHLLPLVEQSLQRKVEFGNIDVGLLSGVSIADLKIKQRQSDDDFVSVSMLTLDYRFISLFKGKIEINQVLLEQPQIKVTRFADGTFDFDDLVNFSRSGDHHSARQSKTEQKTTAATIPLTLLIKQVKVSKGTIEFTDRFRNQRTPYRYALEKVNLEARKMTFDAPFPIDVSAVLNGTQIDVSGSYNILQRSGELLVHSAALDVVRFAPYFRDHLPVKLGSALLSTNLEVEIRPQLIMSRGKLNFDQLDLLVKQSPQLKLKDVELDIDYAFSFDRIRQRFDLSTLLVNLNGLQAAAEASLDLREEDPVLVSQLTLNQLDLRQVMQLMPIEISRRYQKYSPAGLLSGRFTLDGAISDGRKMLQGGRLNLKDVQVSLRNIRTGVSGDLDLKDGSVTARGLLLSYGELEAQLDLDGANMLDAVPQIKFLLSAETLNLNSVLVQKSGSPVVPEGHGQGNGVGSGVANGGAEAAINRQSGTITIPAELDGRINVAKIIFRNFQFDQLAAGIRLNDNRLWFENVSAVTNDGPVNAFAVIDLNGNEPDYQGQFSVTQPDVGGLMATVLPDSEQTATGRLICQNQFSGRSFDPQRMLDTLRLSGDFRLDEGSIKGSPLVDSLATFLGQSDLKLLSFQSLVGRYNFEGGLVHLMAGLKSSKIELEPQGSVGVDGRLNLKLGTRLAPGLVDRLGTNNGLKKVLTDQQGWGVLPLEIKGSLEHPRIAFDSGALEQQALKKAKQKVSEKLTEKIPANEREPIRQLLDDTLNKLFRQ